MTTTKVFSLVCGANDVSYFGVYTLSYDSSTCLISDSVDIYDHLVKFPPPACFGIRYKILDTGQTFVVRIVDGSHNDFVPPLTLSPCSEVTTPFTHPFAFNFSCGGVDYHATGSINYDGTTLSLDNFTVELAA
ncbi:MAG: hypothetical protein WB783_16180 [Arenicellales bacterium]